MRDMQCLAVEFVKMSHRSKSMQAAGLFVSSLHNVLCDELCWTMNTGTRESPAKKADALLQLLRGPSLPCQSQRHTDAMLPRTPPPATYRHGPWNSMESQSSITHAVYLSVPASLGICHSNMKYMKTREKPLTLVNHGPLHLSFCPFVEEPANINGSGRLEKDPTIIIIIIIIIISIIIIITGPPALPPSNHRSATGKSMIAGGRGLCFSTLVTACVSRARCSRKRSSQPWCSVETPKAQALRRPSSTCNWLEQSTVTERNPRLAKAHSQAVALRRCGNPASSAQALPRRPWLSGPLRAKTAPVFPQGFREERTKDAQRPGPHEAASRSTS